MRRTYITPEFKYSRTYGSYNMKEVSTFFGSKMMKCEYNISITNQNLIYYQQLNNEQTNIINEMNISKKIISMDDVKKEYSSLYLDETQTKYQKQTKSLWNLEIDGKNILRQYLFGQIKVNRSFENMTNNLSYTNNIDDDIYDYIDYNILNRYKYSKIEMFLDYKDIHDSISNKIHSNTFINNKNKFINFRTELDDMFVYVTFAQEKPAELYNFEWYYNIYYELI